MFYVNPLEGISIDSETASTQKQGGGPLKKTFIKKFKNLPWERKTGMEPLKFWAANSNRHLSAQITPFLKFGALGMTPGKKNQMFVSSFAPNADGRGSPAHTPSGDVPDAQTPRLIVADSVPHAGGVLQERVLRAHQDVHHLGPVDVGDGQRVHPHSSLTRSFLQASLTKHIPTPTRTLPLPIPWRRQQKKSLKSMEWRL